ncbi:unnamed protein product [Trypanosoma congolense IL3000]|uniref:WGS project CAEQ00000000 data, annotated contig 333 n=1 Tax=Trypanosoma congolense (strain IL3000) TaxID=1068625 RepID=F9WF02_TRYCI|nr:unnamed protein product [Trypanosoma congolense IL3000]
MRASSVARALVGHCNDNFIDHGCPFPGCLFLHCPSVERAYFSHTRPKIKDQMSQQLACTYAAFILADGGKVDADKIISVAKAGGVTVCKGMATAFASILDGVNVEDMLKSISFGGGAVAVSGGGNAAPATGAPGGSAATAAPVKEEEEEDDDMGFGLFD